MELTVYLSGEIHTNWREEIIEKCNQLNLPIDFLSPVTNHELSDDVGVKILGEEDNKFWHDHKSAKINSIRTKNAIEQSDIVIVRFGEKYGMESKSLIVMHSDEACFKRNRCDQKIVKILNYSMLIIDKTDKAISKNSVSGIGYEPTYSSNKFMKRIFKNCTGLVTWGVTYDLSEEARFVDKRNYQNLVGMDSVFNQFESIKMID